MDRPRFQVDIQTMIVAVMAVAVPIGVARTTAPAMGLLLAFVTSRPAIYMFVRGLARAEGRPMYDPDREKVQALYVRVCFAIVAICLIYIGLMLNLSPKKSR